MSRNVDYRERKFSLKELASGEHLGLRLSRSTWKRLIKSGELDSLVIRGKRFVAESQLQRFIDRCTIKGKK